MTIHPNPCRFFRPLCSLFLLLIASPWQIRSWAAEIDFARDIRPILSDNCFQCHGPDEEAREAGLRLDVRSGLFEDLGGYAIVEPGAPEESELLSRVMSQDESLLMPPPESNKSLSTEEKELLEAWIAQGAPWSQHWAFIAPVCPDTPLPEPHDWCRNQIDCFVLDRLQKNGLAPSSDAEPYTLVRRLYLDLIGLPPSPEEADQWVARIWPTDSAEAERKQPPPIREAEYQVLVSQLLASPRYGERWARRWLDLARYADTNGYEKDRPRSIWPYRDWVIAALNADMPFDQFTIEQLAGDMLPSATKEQKIATGFHRNTMLNEEGGIDPLEFRFRAMTDRVATTGTTWLGLTLECCQCHTHKYDPISHAEYYQLMAFLNNADEPRLELPGPDFEEQWQKNRARAKELLDQLAAQWQPTAEELPQSEDARSVKRDASPETGETSTGQADSQPSGVSQPSGIQISERERLSALGRAFSDWLAKESENAVQWRVLRPVDATSSLPLLSIQPDHSIFASGDTAKRDDYFIEFAPSAQPITALQLEALPDERLPARGPGSTYYEGTLGDFFLSELRATAAGEELVIASASHSYAKNRFGRNPVAAQLAIDGDVQTGWSVHGRQGSRHVAVFVLQDPLPAGKPLRLQLTFGRHYASSLGKFRVRATSSATAPEARDYPDEIAALLRIPEEQLSEPERQRLLHEFLLASPQVAEQAKQIRQLQARPEVPHTLVLAEWPAGQRRTTYRHHRGEFLQPREEVAPATPDVLHPLPEQSSRDRLGFARWLVSTENPLTARVVVNRAWAGFFGHGLVRTANDFGLQGEPPSHPDLLDWLAWQFMHDYQWSLKDLHRAIVTSRAYRQSSVVNLQAEDVDPENRWLSSMPRFRLEAEILRDSWLAASGRLCATMGGPPVRPPQPAGVTEVAYGSPKWNASQGGDRFRRSIYTLIKRTAPFAMFATFDAPSGEACIATRTRTNSPLQALTILNDEMLIELARATGAAMVRELPRASKSQALTRLFRRILTRYPSREELVLMERFFEDQLRKYREDPELARDLLEIEESADGDETARWAAWTATARAIFGLDEAQMRE